MARQQPNAMAIAVPQGRDDAGRTIYREATFEELDRESDVLAAGFDVIGIRRGVRTVLMVTPGFEFFALTFALFKLGAVPVMVDPGMGVRALKKCLDEAQPKGFIGVAKAHAARALLGWGRKTVTIPVSVGPTRFFGGVPLEEVRASGERLGLREATPTRPSDVAAILFTSGSTGTPKGAVYTHGNFCAQVEMLRDMYGIQPGEIDLPTFPLFALFDPALGMSTVVPEMDFTHPVTVDPKNITDAVERYGVTNLFGSPAVLDRVGRYGEREGVQLPTVRRVLSAGAAVPPPVLRRMTAMLPEGAQVFTPYGATEVLPVATIGSDEILSDTATRTECGHGVCVGRPVRPNDVRIIRIEDVSIPHWHHSIQLPQGEVGEITVAGPTVTASYFGRDEATALAKIDHDGAVRHRMGDLGRFDEDGRLWFCGRMAHRVETAKGRLFTTPVEAILNQHEAVFRSALVGVGKPGSAIPVVCVELEPTHAKTDRRQLFTELRELAAAHARTASIEHFLVHPGFPVDARHNAKIRREQLAVWARRKLPRKFARAPR